MSGKIKSLADPTLLPFLRNGELITAAQEEGITNLRAHILRHVIGGGDVALEIMSALASFCLACEYVLTETPQETDMVERLRPETSVLQQLMLACFRPILTEKLPISEIRSLRPLSNETAKAVQTQYEQNPYPRWHNLPRGPVADTVSNILNAGCGTGRDILIDASAAPNSSYTGIDLSTVSLAYALARSREFGIENVRFVHGDLRDVNLLGDTFDYIKSIGVLHHMDDPRQGLQALKSVLKPNGTLKIAVYSRRARAAILEAIQLRKALDIPATPSGIREFRRILLQLPPDHPAKPTVMSVDFYSMSGARDLLFHVQEHNFTIRQIADLIEESGLRITKFGAASDQERKFRALGYSDLTDLKAWEKAEEEDPSLFNRSMYSILLAH